MFKKVGETGWRIVYRPPAPDDDTLYIDDLWVVPIDFRPRRR